MKKLYAIMIILLFLTIGRCLAGDAVSSKAQIEDLIKQIEALKSGQFVEGFVTSEGIGHKCGTHLFLGLLSVKDQIEPSILEKLLARPERQTYIDTQHFRIHYDTTGTHAPYQVGIDVDPADNIPDYINRTAEIFEYVWSFEIDTLMYPAPPSDDSAGGDSRYDVYVSNVGGAGYYGLTQPETQLDSTRYTSYIEVENDYAEVGYGSNPIVGLSVTAAHEFFHSIHFGLDFNERDGVYPNDKPWWYEVTAVWMEDVVFDEVDDYKLFVHYFYDYPWLGLGSFSRSLSDVPRMMHPYASCVWARFLHERFDRDIIRQIWIECSRVAGYNVLPATDYVLSGYGSSFEEAFLEFTSWNFFTGERADTVDKFSEADEWPDISIRFYTEATPSLYPVGDTFTSDDLVPEPLGANYHVYRTWPSYIGGLQFDFNGEDIYTGNNWLVGVLGWDPASDTLEKFYIDVIGEGTLSFRDWGRYDYLVVIPTVFGFVPGYSSYGYSFLTNYDENLVGNAPLFGELPSDTTVKATKCVNIQLYATDLQGDAIWFSSDTLEGLSLLDNGNGTAILTYCPKMEMVGFSVPVRVEAHDTSGYDAKQIVFYVVSPTDEVFANMFPNPIIYEDGNPITLQYFLPDTINAGDLDIRIFSVAGELIYKFADLSQFNSGFHEIPWNGLNSKGNQLAGGVYIIKVRAGKKSGSGKFAIIR